MEKLGKMSNTKLKLSDLNPHLMCVLCGGYYIDATTIVECLHSFCRSCIVKHLESSKYCPICEVQVHKTKPLINIRPDKTLQDIVYKLVPGLFTSEMRNRRRFYKERPHYIKPNDSESVGEVSDERKIYVNDENITFSLVYHVGPMPTNLENSYKEISAPVQNERRYFKCPTGVTVYHLKKLLSAKYDLNDSNYKIEIYFKDQVLNEEFTLLDISYIYLWKSKGTLDLTYKIFKNIIKRQKIEEEVNDKAINEIEKQSEVNLSTTEMQPVESQEKPETNSIPEISKQEEEEKEKKTVSEKEEPKPEIQPTAIVEETKVESVKIAEPNVTELQKPEPCPKVAKENGVTVSESKEVQLQISESGVISVSQVEDGEVVRTVEETGTKVMNSQTSTGQSLNKGIARGNGEIGKPETVNRVPEQQRKPATKPIKPYKTIRCSPKTWHPVIPKEKLRPTLMKNSDEPKKPLKFFKVRNMPRFLGNPSSGVRPMYAETGENNVEEKKKPEEKKSDAGKSVKAILKIDPKTLRPIEKEERTVPQTPNTPNLLTNPFIPNNNHFLFSDPHLLPPNSGNFSNKSEPKPEKPGPGSFKSPVPNGTYPPICFPGPDYAANFYPFNFPKPPQNFSFLVGDKMDPLLRASRLPPPYANLTGFNVAGFHASLPPSVSRASPHQHFKKMNQSMDKKNESTKETNKNNCDDSVKVNKTVERKEKEESRKSEGEKRIEKGTEEREEKKKEESDKGKLKESEKETDKEGEGNKEKKGEISESASKTEKKLDSVNGDRNTEKDKDNER